MVDKKDKIRGMFLGVFIGDRLGLPVETWTAERIENQHGRITDYKPCKSDWSDDTQLTIAVAEGLLKKPLCMEAQAQAHADAYKEGVYGMGKSTRNALRGLYEGEHWKKVSSNGKDGAGLGNGIAMKISPAAGWYDSRYDPKTGSYDPKDVDAADDFVFDLSKMTHNTELGVSSGAAHFAAMSWCLAIDDDDFGVDGFNWCVQDAAVSAENNFDNKRYADTLSNRLVHLNKHENWTHDDIVYEWEGGCYAYNSLPFTYMFMVKNPNSIEVLYDVVNAGGDTDSNGSMIGAMLGAAWGWQIFPPHLIDGLNEEKRERVMDLAERFYEKFYEN